MSIIHKSQVRLNLETLQGVISNLKASFDEVGHKENHLGRSRFSAWNNINKFTERVAPLSEDGKFVQFEVQGEAKGATARVYYSPSVTSLAMPFREAIVPLQDKNVFVFFDIKSAEFFMNCVFCQETEAVQAYQRGEDIYMHYSYLFPPGTDRKVIKTILIANMYGTTAYSVAKQLGCSDIYAW